MEYNTTEDNLRTTHRLYKYPFSEYVSAWRSKLRGSSYSGNTEGYLAPMITNTQPLAQEGIDACDPQIGHGY